MAITHNTFRTEALTYIIHFHILFRIIGIICHASSVKHTKSITHFRKCISSIDFKGCTCNSCLWIFFLGGGILNDFFQFFSLCAFFANEFYRTKNSRCIRGFCNIILFLSRLTTVYRLKIALQSRPSYPKRWQLVHLPIKSLKTFIKTRRKGIKSFKPGIQSCVNIRAIFAKMSLSMCLLLCYFWKVLSFREDI